MLNRVLIANRGEIACRIIRTCQRLGVETVAVYSDADSDAMHVAMADQAVRLGPPPAAESYLRGDLIIEAALATSSDAIHPGYGFLSENPDFVDAVEKAGIVFIGPPAQAIRAMGLKDQAKALLQTAGVPVVPGYLGDNQDPDVMADEAAKIGYPVLIKARAGGGGKGMRRVDAPQDFPDALAGASREATASFGDGHCLIEKWIDRPRHIETQIFGDDHGNVVHLFERDCSLQRRHQKVIEEAPAPGMTAGLRDAMGAAAVTAAKAVDYSGAGTVEFIVDVSDGLRPDRFWFMEMNTRIQVEHPVTEFVTGLDLVEWQLRVAAGEPLPLNQEDLAIDGWAIEARVYAEDVGKGFLPATGRLAYLSLPDETARIDRGVRQGDAITPFYDPMIAKLIVHGPTRAAALANIQTALAESFIAGTVTNLAFLSALCADEHFAAGNVDTGLIERHLDRLVETPEPTAATSALAALVVLGLAATPNRADPWASLAGWRLWSPDKQSVQLESGNAMLEAIVTETSDGAFIVDVDNTTVVLRLIEIAGERIQVDIDGRVTAARAVQHGRHVTVFLAGQTQVFSRPDPLDADDEVLAGGGRLAAPMPGLIKLVHIDAGAPVTKGDALVVMEAMKMEHTMKAPFDGTVEEVFVAEGSQVAADDILLMIKAEES